MRPIYIKRMFVSLFNWYLCQSLPHINLRRNKKILIKFKNMPIAISKGILSSLTSACCFKIFISQIINALNKIIPIILSHMLNCSFHRNIFTSIATISAISHPINTLPILLTSTSKYLHAKDNQINITDVRRKTLCTLPNPYARKTPVSAYPCNKAKAINAKRRVCILRVCRFREVRKIIPNHASSAIQYHVVLNHKGIHHVLTANAVPNARSNMLPTRLNICVIWRSIFACISVLLKRLASRFHNKRRSS